MPHMPPITHNVLFADTTSVSYSRPWRSRLDARDPCKDHHRCRGGRDTASRLGLIAGSAMEAAAVPSPRQAACPCCSARRTAASATACSPSASAFPAAVGTTTGGATVAAVAARRRGGWGMRFRPPAPVEDDELPEPELLDDDELLDDELDELELLDDGGGGCCRRGRRAGRSDWMTTRSREIPMGRRLAGRRRGLHWAMPLLIFSQTSHNPPSSERLELGGAMAFFVQRGLNCEKMRR